MLRHIGLMILCAGLAAGGAAAEEDRHERSAVPVQFPGRPEMVAAARAEADRLIHEAGAEAYFTNITVSEVPTVQHNASKIVCAFEPGAQMNRLLVFPADDTTAPGEDVGCNTQAGEDFRRTRTLYATRYKPTLPAREAVAMAADAIRQRWPDARPRATSTVVHDSRTPKPDSAAFDITLDGQPAYTRVNVAVVGGWTLKMRVTAPLADEGVVDTLDGLVFSWAALLPASGIGPDVVPLPAPSPPPSRD